VGPCRTPRTPAPGQNRGCKAIPRRGCSNTGSPAASGRWFRGQPWWSGPVGRPRQNLPKRCLRLDGYSCAAYTRQPFPATGRTLSTEAVQARSPGCMYALALAVTGPHLAASSPRPQTAAPPAHSGPGLRNSPGGGGEPPRSGPGPLSPTCRVRSCALVFGEKNARNAWRKRPLAEWESGPSLPHEPPTYFGDQFRRLTTRASAPSARSST